MIDRQKDEQYHEMLNNGEMYDSVDDEFIAYQHELVQRLNDFNRTDETPEGLKERDEILKEICGTYGEDLYVIPPESANCGLRHVHFGKRVVVRSTYGRLACPRTSVAASWMTATSSSAMTR